MIVDLHMHSYHSDGTMSPEEILTAAIENGVGLISLTDHDILEGARELKELCEHSDIIYLPGVELNSLNQGNTIHILGYGIDIENQEFEKLVSRNRVLLDDISVKLIDKMQKDYDNINPSDYEDYTYDKRKGGWKALHYLQDKGITHHLREAFPFYSQYGCTYDCVAFPSVEEVCKEIRKAGGKAILAHPGVTIKTKKRKAFKEELLRLIALGVDGVECYYPKHSKDITKICLDVCREQKLLITTGSDCHGTFGDAEVGEMKIPLEWLELGDLLEGQIDRSISGV